jgi:hypothetical protein
MCEISAKDREMISTVKDVPIQDVAQIACTARSLWKPNHGFGGLLYRIGDKVMFAHPEVGDCVVELQKFVSLNVAGIALVCCYAEEFRFYGDINSGMRHVQPAQNVIMFEAAMISRKIMLVPAINCDTCDPDEDQEMTYTIVDYMRRVFPVTSGTVVIPYYPEVHDIVEVKGNDGEEWKAHVIKFSISRNTINARFFVHHPTEQNKWIPENSPIQLIHFSSILSLPRGYWEVMYTCWIEEM